MLQVTIDELVARARLESGLRSNAYYDTSQIIRYLNAGGAELHDLMVTTNQKYVISEFDFTTTGPSDAIVALPDDFQQGHSLDIYPGELTKTRTVRYLSNWLDRNSVGGGWSMTGGREPVYTFLADNLRFYPPQAVPAADFKLYYTPQWVDLAVPTTREFAITGSDVIEPFGWIFNSANFIAGEVGSVITPAFTQVTRTFDIDTADNPVTDHWVFLNAAFVAGDVGGTITPDFDAPNAAFNVTYTIVAVLSDHFVQVTPSPATIPATFNNPAGGTASVAALSNSVFNVPYTITAVTSGQQIEVTPDPESLGTFTTPPTGTASVATPAIGTIDALPRYMGPWSEYLVVYAAMAINIDRQRPIGELERKLQALKTRVLSVLGERQEEPQQPPLTRGSDGWFGGSGWGW